MEEKIYDFDNIEDIYPLSDIQVGMLYESLIPGTASAYYSQTQEVPFRDKNFNFDLFKRALSLLVDKHPMLRTGFDIENPEKPVQVVYKKIPLEIGYHDLCGTGPAAREAYIKSCLQREREKCFNLSGAGPLWRSIIFKTGEEEYYFAHINHHAIHDGWSLASFLTELNNTYLQLKVEPNFVPTRLKSTYKNFIIEQVIEKKNVKTIEFWKNELADYKRFEIPGGGSGNIGKTDKIAITRDIGIQTLEKLVNMAKKYGISLRNIFFAAYVYTLYMVSYENDFVVGMVTHIRPEVEDGEKIIGPFLNEVPVRVRIPAQLKWINFIRLIDRKLTRLTDYNKLSLLEIARIIGEIIQGKNPIFETIFTYTDFHVYNRVDRSLLGGMGTDTGDNPYLLESEQFVTNTSLDFTVDISGMLNVIFLDSLLTNEMVERLCCYFMKVLRCFSDEPGTTARKEVIMTGGERQKILYEFNKTEAGFPRGKTIHRLFEEQVERWPNQVALVGPKAEAKKRRGEEEKKEAVPSGQVLNAFGEEAVPDVGAALRGCPVPDDGPVQLVRSVQLTYRELNEKSNPLAQWLIEKGVRPDTIVGIMVERSLEMVIGILAILKSGGAYLPIDPDYPQERIQYMLKDSNAQALVVDDTSRASWSFFAPKALLNLSEGHHPVFPSSHLHSFSRLSSFSQLPSFSSSQLPSSLAYIIYTSGTTGKPKGVLIQHRNVVRLMFNDKFPFDFSDREVWTLFHSICFDFSVWEMYGALLYGGKLVIVPKVLARDTAEFLGLLEREAVTVLNQTPSAFYNLINEGMIPQKEVNLYIKYVIFGGEALNPSKLKIWQEKYPRTRLVNMFGITETTVHVTYKGIGEKEIQLNIGNIGKPIPTLSTYILDKYLKQEPVGVRGEICVGGEGLARGYLNRVELTGEKFIENPYKPGDLLYRSGDTGRYLENGDIQYLGRIDQQVKIRGYRVELGEIENRLLEHPGIEEAVLEAREEQERGGKYLCAYIVPGKDNEYEAAGIREFLSKELPDYMIPSYFVRLEKIPLTPNGKVDRKALPKPEIKAEQHYVAPRNGIETKLVEVWAEVLNIQPGVISIDRSFFELGGHSLKATVLASKVHKEFNIILPLVEIFISPTIMKLGEYIIDKNRDIQREIDRNLVLLKEGSNRDKPLFFIHDGTGDVEGYVELCKNLKIDNRCWGIQAAPLENYTPVNLSVENIAANYIKTLRKLQPHGPYCMAGWSLGGVIAFEMAIQLEGKGEKISFLGLIDSPTPIRDANEKIASFTVETERNLLMDYLPADPIKKKVKDVTHIYEIWPLVVNHLEVNNINVETVKPLIPDALARVIPNYDRVGTRDLIYYLNMHRTLARALMLYLPARPIDTPVHYFKAGQSPETVKKGWHDYCKKPLKIHQIEGDHFSILRKPAVSRMGEIFTAVFTSFASSSSES